MSTLPHALALLRQGDVQGAVRAARAVAAARPADPRPHRLLAHALNAQGRVAEALAALGEASARAPEDGAILAELGAMLLIAGQPRSAVPVLERAVHRAPGVARTHAHLGLAKRELGDAEGAIQALQQAVTLAPKEAEHRANLASVFEATNRNDEALASAELALSAAPGHPLASVIKARIDIAAGRHAEARGDLDRLLSRPLPDQERAWALAERGTTLDRLGASALAFQDFVAAQELEGRMPAAARFDRAAYPRMVAAVRSWLPALRGRPLPPPAVERPAPALLVGFPRSGTTLLHRMLDAHPGVVSVEEQEMLAGAIRRMEGLRGGAVPYPHGLTRLTAEERRTLALDYWRRTDAALDGPQAGRLVLDKMPLNLVHLGFVREVLPDARIIMVLRDPRDCVLSALMQTFTPTVAMVQFHTLEDSAAAYAGVMGCWLAAREHLGLAVHVVRYEDVVADSEAVLRPLLAFLGLPWDDGVRAYFRHSRGKHIATPSHQDVSKPVFTRSRGRWRRYQDQLSPVLPVLQPFVDALGYS